MLDLKMISQEAEDKGNMRTKKMYMSKGAVEPLFGNTISSLKPIAKNY